MIVSSTLYPAFESVKILANTYDFRFIFCQMIPKICKKDYGLHCDSNDFAVSLWDLSLQNIEQHKLQMAARAVLLPLESPAICHP